MFATIASILAMEQILNIPKPKNQQHIIWEHAMKSVFAALITFVILFLIPFILIGGKRSSEWEQEKGAAILKYLDLHPVVIIGICLVVLLFINLRIHFRNRKKKYIFEITEFENEIEFGISNLFHKKIDLKRYQKSVIKVFIISSTTDLGKKSIVRFMNTEFSNPIGEIQIDHVLYHAANRKIITAIKRLEKNGLEIERIAGKSSNHSASILRGITGWK